MKTNWNLIREMTGAAIDLCEQIESIGYTENDRSATTGVNGQDVSVHDFLISAWSYPENISYQIIRERHDKEADLPCVPEAARILVAMAHACAELIGAEESAPADDGIKKMIHWFHTHAAPGIKQAIEESRRAVI